MWCCAAPLRMRAVWYLGAAWLLMQATSFAILFWAPLLLDAIMSGSFDAAPRPAPAPPRSQHDEVLTWPACGSWGSVVAGRPQECVLVGALLSPARVSGSARQA